LAAGVRRPELHNATTEQITLRIHDLRGSFVTIALANRRSESWVEDRTWHRSSQMLAQYKRATRTAAELSLGDLTPLDAALGLDSEAGKAPGAVPAAGTATVTTRSRLLDLNLRPVLYESTALPLS
jgi:hypothetical protein